LSITSSKFIGDMHSYLNFSTFSVFKFVPLFSCFSLFPLSYSSILSVLLFHIFILIFLTHSSFHPPRCSSLLSSVHSFFFSHSSFSLTF
jgi:hypothetical protein